MRTEAERRGRAIAVLLDLQGPKIRVGRFANGQIELKPGAEFTITTDTNVIGDERRVSTVYSLLPRDVKPGDQILLDDGYLSLTVTGVAGSEVTTRVVAGGVLKNNKGINVRCRHLTLSRTPRQARYRLRAALRRRLRRVVVRPAAEDVLECKRLLTVDQVSIPVISKIEKPQALERLDDIIDASDGIMVARGDLGVELGPEKVPLWQKRIIEETNRRGKIVITATQMLESMIRASAAVARRGVRCRERGSRCDRRADVVGRDRVGRVPGRGGAHDGAHHRRDRDERVLPPEHRAAGDRITSIRERDRARGGRGGETTMKLKTIVTVSDSGGVARLVSEYRPEAGIVALTTNEVTFRRLALIWGVTPSLIGPSATTEELIDRVEATLLERNLARPGENVLIAFPSDPARKLTS